MTLSKKEHKLLGRTKRRLVSKKRPKGEDLKTTMRTMFKLKEKAK